MKIYLYCDKKVNVFFLPENVSGSYSFDSNSDEIIKLINIDARDGKWVLFETFNCKIIYGNSYVKEVCLVENNFYVITRNNINYLIYVTSSNDNNILAYNYNNKFNISYGIPNSTVSYNCPYVKNICFQIKMVENNNLLLQFQTGTFYINKNELLQKQYYIQNGDELEIYGVKLLFVNKLLIVIASPSLFSINQVESGLILTDLKNYDEIRNIDIKDKELYQEDDFFSKSPRIRRVVKKRKIELSQPPTEEKSGEMPFLLTAGPMFTMGISSVVMMSSSINQLASGMVDFKDSAGGLISGTTMLLSTLLWPILTSKYNDRVREKNNKKTKEKYNKYLEEKEQELSVESKLQQEIIKENVISINECLDNLKHHKLNFWDKRIDQSDFLVARIGVGDEELKVDINYPEKGFTVEEDELKKQVEQMVDKYKYIKDVPIGYSFYENNVTAIMGNMVKAHYFINNVLLQLLTFYSYDDLKLVVFTNEKNSSNWNYVKYLNHNMTNDSSFRFFASSEENASIVCDVLNQEIDNRIAQLGDDQQQRLYKPYYLVIIDDLDVLKKSALLDKLTELKVNIGFSIIILESKLSKLPSLCNNFINLGDNKSGVLKNSYEKQEQFIFKDEINPNINMMEAAKILANIPIEISSGDEAMGELPDAITFLEMAKVGKVEQLNILNRWNTNDSTSNLKAEVGVGLDGKLMYLDLHEKAHGPHGLIAGMTGSGKSEFIITWILSLCMNFSPDDVSFILIDYKGGGLAFAFENQSSGIRLPHLAGTITNLDKAEINRTLVSIDSEVKRRQRIFNEARDMLGESTIDIYKYQGFYHDGKLKEPLPHLFIVCDEFAELKAQQPDFMDNLISVARIGRSLGVHLILATQKPSGVVNDQIWSNTKFRVCLKVQDASDSNEMLKKPDAASLKQTGRFYLQVGYDEYYALGQSGWCGAKYYPSEIIKKSIDKSVNIIDETGVVLKNIQSGNNNQKGEAQGEQLAAVLNEIINASKQSNRFARRLWLDNIPGNITVSKTEEKYNYNYSNDKYEVLIGEYDAPEAQAQHPLTYNLLEDGNGNIIGNDSMEYETLITTILYNIMSHYRPDEVSYYIIDYGSQGFVKFAKAPHCGGVVTPSDSEKFTNLIKLITEEQKNRKSILSEFGGEYTEYVKKNPNKMPIMLIVMNNFESINEANSSLYEILGELLRDSERYGIVYLITSSTPTAVPDRYRQLMPFSLALKLKEVSDYTYVFPGQEKKEPKNIFGRGICLQEILHEFQTAFICEDRTQETNFLLSFFEQLRNQNLPHATLIPSLPNQVTLQDVSQKIKGLRRIPVGIEKGTLNIMSLNLTNEIAKIIITNKMKYIKSFLKSFIDELFTVNQNNIIFDAVQLYPNMEKNIKNYYYNDFDSKIDQVIDYVEKNSEKQVILVIIGISKLLDKLESSSKFDSLVSTFKSKGNAHILIVDEIGKLKDKIYDDWFKIIDTSQGVYVGVGVEDNGILKLTEYSRELSQKLPNNYGFYIEEGSYHIIKLIEFERIEDDDDDEE